MQQLRHYHSPPDLQLICGYAATRSCICAKQYKLVLAKVSDALKLVWHKVMQPGAQFGTNVTCRLSAL